MCEFYCEVVNSWDVRCVIELYVADEVKVLRFWVSMDSKSICAIASLVDPYPRKKRVSERVSPGVMHIIRSETFGETFSDTFWHEKSCQDSRWDLWWDCWRNFSRQKVSPRVSNRIICMTPDETLSETRFFFHTRVAKTLMFHQIGAAYVATGLTRRRYVIIFDLDVRFLL